MQLCNFEVGDDQPMFLIAGPCVVESEAMAMDTAGTLKELTGELGIPFIYKSSYDKANRTSYESYRGPGVEKGLDCGSAAEARSQSCRDPHIPSSWGAVFRNGGSTGWEAWFARQPGTLLRDRLLAADGS